MSFPLLPAADAAAVRWSRISREVRGIPLWLMHAYLVEAGGASDGENRVVGDGWEVRLTQLEDFRIGSLSVGQIRVELEPARRLGWPKSYQSWKRSCCVLVVRSVVRVDRKEGRQRSPSLFRSSLRDSDGLENT
jgi:hypothetical protein